MINKLLFPHHTTNDILSYCPGLGHATHNTRIQVYFFEVVRKEGRLK